MWSWGKIFRIPSWTHKGINLSVLEVVQNAYRYVLYALLARKENHRCAGLIVFNKRPELRCPQLLMQHRTLSNGRAWFFIKTCEIRATIVSYEGTMKEFALEYCEGIDFPYLGKLVIRKCIF